MKMQSNPVYPVDIVLAPEWWHRHTGMTFDRDFFFHPARRVEEEARMERILYERWGQYGLGSQETHPEIGPVHLAAGYLLQEMLGCQVDYRDGHPPQVICAQQEQLHVDPEAAFASDSFRAFTHLCDQLQQRHGHLTGDVNFAGILNIALDLRGQDLFIDMHTDPKHVHQEFAKIAEVITRFVDYVMARTGSSSISVNRTVRHLPRPVVLHSECTHTMISARDYETFLMNYDIQWDRRYSAFGIHYCGPDAHRYAPSFAKIPGLYFVDVGSGGDVQMLRQALPQTFLNLRLDPVKLREQSPDQIHNMVHRLARDSLYPTLTGLCCINMDDTITDEQISAIFEATGELRQNARREAT